MRKYLVGLIAAAALLVVPTTSQAYFHQANAYNQCIVDSYATAEASFANYGVHADTGNKAMTGWYRYSDTRVYVYIVWVSNPIRYSVDTWCDFAGNDYSWGGSIFHWYWLGASAVRA